MRRAYAPNRSISRDGTGSWVSARSFSGGDAAITQVAANCAPALSNDQKTLYFAVSTAAEFGAGYLVSADSITLNPKTHVELLDPRGGLATVSSDSSTSPMVGADGAPMPRSQWLFPAIDKVFEELKRLTGSTRTGYTLYGHSAGGQFVHRLATFAWSPLMERAVSANAGPNWRAVGLT